MGGGEFSKVVFKRGLASLAANPSVEQDSAGSGVETFSAGFSINMADYDTLLGTSLAANSPTGFSYADMSDPSSGSELRFADSDGKSLDYDVEEWNADGASLVWVKVPSLTKTATPSSARR